MQTETATPPAPLDDTLMDDIFALSDDDIVVEGEDLGNSYPIIAFLNGAPKGAKGTVDHTGGFFINVDDVPSTEALEAIGFKPFTKTTSTGDEIKGYSADQIEVYPVAKRRAWSVLPEGSKRSEIFAYNRYDDASVVGSARQVGHLLVLLKGAEDLGLFMVTFKGMVAAEVFGQDGIYRDFTKKVVIRARTLAALKGRRQKFPASFFSLTLGVDKDEKGKPKFTEVGEKTKNMITKPVWVDRPGETLDSGGLNALFAGRDKIARLQGFMIESEEWVASYSAENLARRTSDSDASSQGTDGADHGADDGGDVGY